MYACVHGVVMGSVDLINLKSALRVRCINILVLFHAGFTDANTIVIKYDEPMKKGYNICYSS